MIKKITMLSLVFALLTCGVAMAGPVANTQQFQQKAVKSAARGIADVSSQQKPVVEGQVSEGAPVEGQPAGEQPAGEQPAEEEKIKIEITEQEINKRVPSYKNNLKDIVRETEANIKRIDDALKAEDAEKGAKEHYDKGNALYKEGKFEEAGKEWNTALGLAKEREFRKCIRASLKRSARQIRIAKEKREAEEWAKKKDQLRGKPEAVSKEPDLKK